MHDFLALPQCIAVCCGEQRIAVSSVLQCMVVNTFQPLLWEDACPKLETYFWAVDAVTSKATSTQFPNKFFADFVKYFRPTVGKKPKIMLDKIYHFANLVPDDVPHHHEYSRAHTAGRSCLSACICF